MARVLVTGGTGFVAAHCLVKLLKAGHETRATVRDLKREPDLRALLTRGGAGDVGERLTLVKADLNADTGWREAARGCDFVLHVASPFPAVTPKDENELIAPARDGALRVLRAARDAGVKRVVLTSSFAAIGYGGKPRLFTEADWTDPDAPGVQPYQKSKTLAERAAWDFVAREGGGMELCVIAPVGVFGPALGAPLSTSLGGVKRMLDGAVPGFPALWFGVVDVRDVADLHISAMTHARAAGERFLATSGDFLSLAEIALMVKQGAGPLGKRVPTRRLPGWLVRIVGLFDPEIGRLTPELGKRKNASNAKAREVFGWTPICARDALTASARSLAELGLLKSV